MESCPLSRVLSFRRSDCHFSGANVAVGLKRPTRRLKTARAAPPLPIRAFSQWGLHCHVCHQTRGELLPHLFTLAGGRSHLGGSFSVALSLRSPSVAVSHHCALWSPDFPRLTQSQPRQPEQLSVQIIGTPPRQWWPGLKLDVLAQQHHRGSGVDVLL